MKRLVIMFVFSNVYSMHDSQLEQLNNNLVSLQNRYQQYVRDLCVNRDLLKCSSENSALLKESTENTSLINDLIKQHAADSSEYKILAFLDKGFTALTRELEEGLDVVDFTSFESILNKSADEGYESPFKSRKRQKIARSNID